MLRYCKGKVITCNEGLGTTKKHPFFFRTSHQFKLILGDPGADSGGEGKSKRAEKYGTKKSKEQREEPMGTMGAFHLGKKSGNLGGSKSGISDW